MWGDTGVFSKKGVDEICLNGSSFVFKAVGNDRGSPQHFIANYNQRNILLSLLHGRNGHLELKIS